MKFNNFKPSFCTFFYSDLFYLNILLVFACLWSYLKVFLFRFNLKFYAYTCIYVCIFLITKKYENNCCMIGLKAALFTCTIYKYFINYFRMKINIKGSEQKIKRTLAIKFLNIIKLNHFFALNTICFLSNKHKTPLLQILNSKMQMKD